MRNKIFAFFLSLIVLSGNSWAAWNDSLPADNEKLKDTPAEIRANWAAIELGTDSALLITNAKISSSAAIADSKLGTIATAGKVDGTSITDLAGVPSGAGAMLIANGGTGQSSRQAALNALSAASLTGTSGEALVSDGTNIAPGYPASLTISSMAQGDILFVDSTPKVNRLAAGTKGQALTTNGSSANPSYQGMTTTGDIEYFDGTIRHRLPIGTTGQALTVSAGIPAWGGVASFVPTNIQVFSSSGTWTKPASCSSAYVKIWGAGGGSGENWGSSPNFGFPGGPGGYSEGYTAVSGNVSVTIGTGGAGGIASGGGGSVGADGQSGGTSSFPGITTIQATGGSGGAQSTGTSLGWTYGPGGSGSGGQINFTGPTPTTAIGGVPYFGIGFAGTSTTFGGSGVATAFGGSGYGVGANGSTHNASSQNGAGGYAIVYC